MKNEIHYQKFIAQNPYPRELASIESATSSVHIVMQGRSLINFSSNDYLGLSNHPVLIARSYEYAQRWGVGSSSSRLVTGNLSVYETLENQLAQALGRPAALILGAGYQANISILEALLDAQVLGQKALVFCDRYCHISMMAMTQHMSRLLRFQHNDLAHLQRLLDKYATSTQPKFILVESIYSMDGDEANLEKLTALAKQYNATLYVDDAHAVGVYGKHGWGKAMAYDADVIMGTFSKGLGSFGAYVACSEVMREYFINKCRGLIYSTSLSPAVLGAIAGAIEVLPQLDQQRQQLQAHTRTLRDFFHKHNLAMGKSNTHIIPWIIGDAEKSLHVSEMLQAEGILATTIRPPTVPVGKSRIRFCLSAAHSVQDIEVLMRAITSVLNTINIT